MAHDRWLPEALAISDMRPLTNLIFVAAGPAEVTGRRYRSRNWPSVEAATPAVAPLVSGWPARRKVEFPWRSWIRSWHTLVPNWRRAWRGSSSCSISTDPAASAKVLFRLAFEQGPDPGGLPEGIPGAWRRPGDPLSHQGFGSREGAGGPDRGMGSARNLHRWQRLDPDHA